MRTETLVEAKPFWKSKTIIFNVLALLVAVLPVIETWAGQTELTIPLWVTEILVLLIPLSNVLLRFVTDRPVASKTKPVPVKSGT